MFVLGLNIDSTSQQLIACKVFETKQSKGIIFIALRPFFRIASKQRFLSLFNQDTKNAIILVGMTELRIVTLLFLPCSLLGEAGVPLKASAATLGRFILQSCNLAMSCQVLINLV